MSKLQAVLWDVDGTLADTERDGHRVAFNRAFAEAGFAWNWGEELYGTLLQVSGGKERLRFFFEQHCSHPPPEPWDAWIPKLHKAKTKHYLALLAEGAIPLRPGVERLLRELLAAKVRLAIVTTTTPENVTTLLTHTLGPASISWFECIAAGDVVPAKKPSPDIYHYTLQQMQLSPDTCIALEDSENGLRSALGADITTLVTQTAYTRTDDFTGARLVTDHLGEPETPMQIVAGKLPAQRWVTLDLLRELCDSNSR